MHITHQRLTCFGFFNFKKHASFLFHITIEEILCFSHDILMKYTIFTLTVMYTIFWKSSEYFCKALYPDIKHAMLLWQILTDWLCIVSSKILFFKCFLSHLNPLTFHWHSEKVLGELWTVKRPGAVFFIFLLLIILNIPEIICLELKIQILPGFIHAMYLKKNISVYWHEY